MIVIFMIIPFHPIPIHSLRSAPVSKKKTKKIWEEIKEHMENGRKSTEGYEVKYVLQCKLVGLGNSFFLGGQGIYIHIICILLCIFATDHTLCDVNCILAVQIHLVKSFVGRNLLTQPPDHDQFVERALS